MPHDKESVVPSRFIIQKGRDGLIQSISDQYFEDFTKIEVEVGKVNLILWVYIAKNMRVLIIILLLLLMFEAANDGFSEGRP